jgi:tetratricopeptide (TPR) repeat protein
MTETGHHSSDPERQKPTLTPPDSPKVRKKDNRVTVLLLTIGLLVLLGIAAMVTLLLPTATKRQNISETLPEILPQPPITQPAAKGSEPGGIRAEKILGEWLKLQARAEADGVSVWGVDTYPAILEEAAGGDRQFLEKKFPEAQKTYQNIIDRLKILLDSKEERLAAALAKGELSLDSNDSLAAAKSFELALAIDPDNEQARHGVNRARNLDQVLILYNKGLDNERENNLKEAKVFLQQAIVIDAQFAAAGEALARVDRSLQEIAFHEAMSRALRALAAYDTAAARRALVEAGSLRPGDISVKYAGQRLAAMERTQKLAKLKDKAEKLADEERWTEALQIYKEALQIDPQFGFAETGRRQAWQRAELDRSVQEILSRPERLQESGPLHEAEQILEMARNVDKPGPRLQIQIKELSQLILAASTPAEVILRSDNETSVVIYRVGLVGQFLEKKVSLLPGTYTVVGSRPGFRDVRLTLKVQAAKNPIILDIRCEEPI